MHGAQASLLPDNRRLHLHHGPIDLIVEAFGSGRYEAYQRATSRFMTVLDELVAELPELRTRGHRNGKFSGSIARRMQAAIAPHCDQFVTPMAAVAGAVADDILQHICDGHGMPKAYVNNGGDIAFHLMPGQHMTAALASVPGGRATLQSSDHNRGIATSGWRGRSFSLGIADSVTVIANHAASADVAATLIANAVNLPDCPAIERTPASDLSPDSDLGEIPVTTAVETLTDGQVRQALSRGKTVAANLLGRGLIGAACIQLCDVVEQVGSLEREQLFPATPNPEFSLRNLTNV